MTDLSVTAREAVLDRLKVQAAYHAVQRQLEYANSHPLMARRHHATYLRLKRVLVLEELNPKPDGLP